MSIFKVSAATGPRALFVGLTLLAASTTASLAQNTAPSPATQPQPPSAIQAATPAGSDLVSGPVGDEQRAKSGQGGRGAMRACKTDANTFCGNIQPGGGGRMRCLMENKAKVSPACATAIETRQQAKQEGNKEANTARRMACAADAKSLCADARGPARRQCLEANRAQLSPDCAAMLKAPRAAKAAANRAAEPMQDAPAPTTQQQAPGSGLGMPPAPTTGQPMPKAQ